jgi:CheY-like chemotaxis protein
VVNLVRNAAGALPRGGTISVRTFVDGDRVVLLLQDDGVGIPKKDLLRIFEPFWTAKGVLGSGTSLERSRNLVKKHRGEIRVESEPGAGSTFTVTLPLAAATADEPKPGEAEELGPELRILVVDDVEPVVRMLRDALTRAGHRVFPALSGRKALEILSMSRIDVVICDLGMPEMNGWQVAKAAKEGSEKKSIARTPFILLTGWGGETGNRPKMEEFGVDEVVEKPLDIAALLKTIRKATGKREVGKG